MMNFSYATPIVVLGTATSMLVSTLAVPAAHALTGTEVNEIARATTVLISDGQGLGSGVLLAREGQKYYVLTNHHVVPKESTQYAVVTSDRKGHKISRNGIRYLPGLDLAVVEFVSETQYPIAKIGATKLNEGQTVFVSGWPAPDIGNQSPELVRQFTSGAISGLLNQPVDGYQMSYTNVTRGGMSGGPVFDTAGRVIGVHGMGGAETPEHIANRLGTSRESAAGLRGLFKTGFNYGIPINTFLQQAPMAGIYLPLQVENSPAEEPKETFVAASEPDSRDVIQNLNDTLNALKGLKDTFGTVCRLFGC